MDRDKLREDFIFFAKHQLLSRDIDPAYPVLEYGIRGVDEDTKLWRLMLFNLYYHLGSAERMWDLQRTFPTSKFAVEILPTGIERRGMRGNIEGLTKWIRSAMHEVQYFGSPSQWMKAAIQGYSPTAGWNRAREYFERIDGNGPWSSYKWADLMKNVMYYPISAPDIGVGGNGKNAGPVPGLSLLTGLDWKTCATDRSIQWKTYENLGVEFTGIDQFETALCDFNSLYKGRYYVGADIDAMMNQLPSDSFLWDARQKVLPPAYLGEMNGWVGVDKARLKIYQETGEVAVR